MSSQDVRKFTPVSYRQGPVEAYTPYTNYRGPEGPSIIIEMKRKEKKFLFFNGSNYLIQHLDILFRIECTD